MGLTVKGVQDLKGILFASYFLAKIEAFFKYRYFHEDPSWEIKPAGSKGDGLFAAKCWKKGSVVFIAKGKTRVWESVTESDPYLYPNWYGVAKNTWIELLYPYVKANHSCKPNMGIDGGRIFVALRDIEVGEELLFDYSITDDEIYWSIPCYCKTEYCTGKIESIQTMSPERFLHSYPYIPKYFAGIYLEIHEPKLLSSYQG